MAVDIREHAPGKDLDDFIRAPKLIKGSDPNFVPMLDMMVRDQLTPSKNPFFKHAEVALFTAWRSGVLVGRISAQVDREHLKRHGDETGFFGFFDCIDDTRVATALLKEAEGWLRARGMKRMRGPLSLSINEESGLLVKGFDTPNMLMCPHNAPYMDELLSAVGLEKAKDLYAWRYSAGELPKRAQRALETVKGYPEVTLRRADIGKEIGEMIAVQDDAWKDNWGHVSLTQEEASHMAKDLALVIDPSIALIAEIHGEVAAICLAIPNLNEAIADLNGSLLPLGWLKLLYRLKIKRPSSARLILLGIKEKYRKQKRYMPLSAALVAKVNDDGRAAGYTWGELSWTLEDNHPVNLLIRSVGGKHYKTYRVYEKPIH